jgi:hypothetical protein
MATPQEIFDLTSTLDRGFTNRRVSPCNERQQYGYENMYTYTEEFIPGFAMVFLRASTSITYSWYHPGGSGLTLYFSPRFDASADAISISHSDSFERYRTWFVYAAEAVAAATRDRRNRQMYIKVNKKGGNPILTGNIIAFRLSNYA